MREKGSGFNPEGVKFDKEEFSEEKLGEYRPFVKEIIKKMIRHQYQDVVDDLTQNVMAFVLDASKKTKIENLKGYLITATRNEVFKYYKMKKRRAKADIEGRSLILENLGMVLDKSAEKWEERIKIYEEALKMISPDSREMWNLHYEKGLNYEQIAKEFKLSYDAVRLRLQYSKKKVIKYLREKFGIESKREAKK